MNADGTLKMGWGISLDPDIQGATEHACALAVDSLNGPADGLFLFFTSDRADHARRIGRTAIDVVQTENIIGTCAESIIGGHREIQGQTGIAALAIRSQGMTWHGFTIADLPRIDEVDEPDLVGPMGLEGEGGGTLVFLDPFSVPLVNLLPAMSSACHGRGPLIGGHSSGSVKAGQTALILGEQVYRAGGVGVTIRGDLRIDPVVSQGCRPVGENMVVTKAKANVLLGLGGKPAFDAVREIVDSLDEHSQALIKKNGLFIGCVVDEYKDRFGRGDYLVRNILGADKDAKAIAINEIVHVGQTVRVHVRDARTADEDFALLLDGQKLHGPPAGSLLITCNGRGRDLFGESGHDSGALARAFLPTRSGEQRAKGGRLIETDMVGYPPQAGFFANGEIGPIGGESFLHGHSAVVGLFREGVGGD